jgi:tetrahydrodipicolinate N-succinyltransferase
MRQPVCDGVLVGDGVRVGVNVLLGVRVGVLVLVKVGVKVGGGVIVGGLFTGFSTSMNEPMYNVVSPPSTFFTIRPSPS